MVAPIACYGTGNTRHTIHTGWSPHHWECGLPRATVGPHGGILVYMGMRNNVMLSIGCGCGVGSVVNIAGQMCRAYTYTFATHVDQSFRACCEVRTCGEIICVTGTVMPQRAHRGVASCVASCAKNCPSGPTPPTPSPPTPPPPTPPPPTPPPLPPTPPTPPPPTPPTPPPPTPPPTTPLLLLLHHQRRHHQHPQVQELAVISTSNVVAKVGLGQFVV